VSLRPVEPPSERIPVRERAARIAERERIRPLLVFVAVSAASVTVVISTLVLLLVSAGPTSPNASVDPVCAPSGSRDRGIGEIDAIRGENPWTEPTQYRYSRCFRRGDQVTKRRTFDVAQVPPSFWRRNDVQTALARREVGGILGMYLAEFPDCTQTQLALMIQHDRSDISNWVRGVRASQVTDIGVLTRIADGLNLSDESRLLLGLAPIEARVTRPISVASAPPSQQVTAPHVGVITGWSRTSDDKPCTRLAVCGSRASGTEQPVIDEAVRSVARWLMTRRLCVIHGPVGVGIEIMTYIADHYRPDNLDSIRGVLGRHNIVAAAQYVLVIGGGSGTRDEVDMAFSLGLKVLPLPTSGGTAARAYSMMSESPALRAWLDVEQFTALRECNDTEAYLRIIEHALTLSPGATK
jgi:hypothetical protein